jgi:uncharacterized membrane protein
MFILMGLITITPLMAASNSDLAPAMYMAFGFTCHQLDSRSICYFPNTAAPINDCTAQDGLLRFGKNNVIMKGDLIGYKIPVCARDIGIYGAMLLGGLLWPLVRKPHSRRWPHIAWLVLALLPTAIDGFTQLFGWRESNNALRLWTGLAMGIGMAFVLIPACNAIFNKNQDGKTAQNEKAKMSSAKVQSHSTIR